MATLSGMGSGPASERPPASELQDGAQWLLTAGDQVIPTKVSGDTWVVEGVGSAEEPVPAVHTERADISGVHVVDQNPSAAEVNQAITDASPGETVVISGTVDATAESVKLSKSVNLIGTGCVVEYDPTFPFLTTGLSGTYIDATGASHPALESTAPLFSVRVGNFGLHPGDGPGFTTPTGFETDSPRIFWSKFFQIVAFKPGDGEFGFVFSNTFKTTIENCWAKRAQNGFRFVNEDDENTYGHIYVSNCGFEVNRSGGAGYKIEKGPVSGRSLDHVVLYGTHAIQENTDAGKDWTAYDILDTNGVIGHEVRAEGSLRPVVCRNTPRFFRWASYGNEEGAIDDNRPQNVDWAYRDTNRMNANNRSLITTPWSQVRNNTQLLEGFETGAISAYSGDTGSFAADSSHPAPGSEYGLNVSAGSNDAAISRTDLSTSQNNTYICWFYLPSGGNVDSGPVIGVQTAAGYSGLEGYGAIFNQNQDSLIIRRFDGGSQTNVHSGMSLPTGELAILMWHWGSGGEHAIELYDSEWEQLDQTYTEDSTYSSGGLGWYGFRSGFFDDFKRIRKE